MTRRPAAEAHHRARAALRASALALAVSLGALAQFLPPLDARTLASLPRTVAAAAVFGAGLVLHWTWLGAAARRQSRRRAPWLALGMGLYPIGGAAALLLLRSAADDPGSDLGTPSGLPAAGHA